MKETSFRVDPGTDIYSAFILVKRMVINHGGIVYFMFNDIKCRVDTSTKQEHLVRDYMNARSMGWKTIGPDCMEEYSDDIKVKLKEVEKRKDSESRIRTMASEVLDLLQSIEGCLSDGITIEQNDPIHTRVKVLIKKATP